MHSRLIAVLWLAPALAQAQTADPRNLFGPADPSIKSPATSYSSAFGKTTESSEVPWKAANDEMRRLGGHMGHMKEGDAPEQTTGMRHGRAAAGAAPAQGSAHHGTH